MMHCIECQSENDCYKCDLNLLANTQPSPDVCVAVCPLYTY